MKPSLEALKALCPDLDERLIRGHLDRLEERYFALFEPAEVAEHLATLDRLGPERPLELAVRSGEDQALECTVIAFDYPGEFSIITGVLGATGFNVLSGDVFTYSPAPAPLAPAGRRHAAKAAPGRAREVQLARRKIIDHFRGRLPEGQPAALWEERLRKLLGECALALERGGAQGLVEARQRVNELVAEQLAFLRLKPEAVLYPLDLSVRQEPDGRTVLRVVSQDTPFFLYTLSTALALRSIYIDYIRIRTVGSRIEDEFSFLDSRGRRITEARLLDQAKLSVLLTKQFTYFLFSAPDPYAALCRFESLVEAVLALPEEGRWLDLLSNPRVLQELARLLGASDFLWEDFIRLQYESLLPMLEPDVRGRSIAGAPENLAARLAETLSRGQTTEERRRALNEFKDREIFLLELEYILGPEAELHRLSRGLTLLAEAVVNAAVELAYRELVERFGRPRTVAGLEAEFAVLGLGKLGGRELGYASDIELLFVYGDQGQTSGGSSQAIRNSEFFEALAREASASVRAKKEGIFQIDLRLRPYGASGPTACSLETFCWYYSPQGEAHALERLALVRLRAIGGSPRLGAQLERIRDELLYSGAGVDLEQLAAARQKQIDERVRRGELNARLSPGALLDLEQTIMLLQLKYGAARDELRTPYLREALERLTALGILSTSEGERLAEAYRFLRRLINSLRMLRGTAADLFLPSGDSGEYVHLARRMGYTASAGLSPAKSLFLDFETHTAAVRYAVELHFGRESLPVASDGNVADLILSDALPAESRQRILAKAGFRQPAKAYRNLRSLAEAGGATPFTRLAVLAADFLRHRPDPDMALNNWERLVRALEQPAKHFQLLLAQPRRLDILLAVFAGSQFLSDTLIRHPDFFEWATQPERLHRRRERPELLQAFRELSGQSASPEAWRDAMRRGRLREYLRLGLRDICLELPIQEIMLELSALAEAILEVALERAASEAGSGTGGELCIVAFGKLGAEELNYSSDIDLLVVARPGLDAERLHELGRVVERLRADLGSHSEEGHVYRVDLRLRPYGRSGELVSGLEGILRYYRQSASLWEVQALLKARPVAGNLELGGRFLQESRELLLGRPFPREEVVRTVCGLRRAARAKLGRSLGGGGLDIKEGSGGIRDLEFLVQALQLMHAPAVLAGGTLAALEGLRRASVLGAAAAEQLKRDYLFLRRIEHYLQIFEDRQTHSLPAEPSELEALARRTLGPQASAARFQEELAGCLGRVAAAFADHLGCPPP
jgi:glutamate-ammonia-ligase adenylyltransferase